MYKTADVSEHFLTPCFLFLPNNDLLQQFEYYVIELRCEKGRRKGEKKYNKQISLKICTKQGVNLRIKCGNGSPE
jgi:hypothetical protein